MCRTCFELAISHLRLSLGLEGYDDLVFSDAEEVPDVVAAHRSRGALSPNNSSSSASCLQHLRCRMREAQNDEREPGTAFDWPPYTLWRRCRRCKLPSPRSSHGLVSPRALLRDGVDSSVAKPIARPALANREVPVASKIDHSVAGQPASCNTLRVAAECWWPPFTKADQTVPPSNHLEQTAAARGSWDDRHPATRLNKCPVVNGTFKPAMGEPLPSHFSNFGKGEHRGLTVGPSLVIEGRETLPSPQYISNGVGNSNTTDSIVSTNSETYIFTETLASSDPLRKQQRQSTNFVQCNKSWAEAAARSTPLRSHEVVAGTNSCEGGPISTGAGEVKRMGQKADGPGRESVIGEMSARHNESQREYDNDRERRKQIYQAKLDGNYSLAKRLSGMMKDERKPLTETQMLDLRTAQALCRNLPVKAAQEGFVLRLPEQENILLPQRKDSRLPNAKGLAKSEQKKGNGARTVLPRRSRQRSTKVHSSRPRQQQQQQQERSTSPQKKSQSEAPASTWRGGDGKTPAEAWGNPRPDAPRVLLLQRRSQVSSPLKPAAKAERHQGREHVSSAMDDVGMLVPDIPSFVEGVQDATPPPAMLDKARHQSKP